MLRAGQSNTLQGGHQQAVSQLIQAVLSERTLGAAYGQQLVKTVDRSVEQDASDSAIGALPSLVCEISGGNPGWAGPVTSTWQLLRLAAKLFDDVEDDEVSSPSAGVINLATGLIFLAELSLAELSQHNVPPDRVERLAQALNRAWLWACAGQHADLACQAGMMNLDPDTWLEIALAKSGEPCAWAAWAGALVADASEQTLTGYHEYGRHLGVLLQVADDWNGIWCPRGASDLAAGQRCAQHHCTQRPNLAVCYALWVTKTEERSRLEALLAQAAQGDSTAEAHARQLLTDWGAQGYLLVVAQMQRQQAIAALRDANCLSPRLTAMLDQVLPALSCARK